MNHSTPILVLLLAMVAATSADPVTAQEGAPPALTLPMELTAPRGPIRALSPVNRADALYFSGDPRASFALLDEYLKVSPDEYEVLWRAARAAVILGVSAEGSRPQNRWLDPAMDLANRAVALEPDGVDGLYWRGAAHGRRAMNASPGYATELAQRVFDDAHAILAQDSIEKVEVLDYEDLGMEAVWKIEVRDFPAFLIVDDKGNDFFAKFRTPKDLVQLR